MIRALLRECGEGPRMDKRTGSAKSQYELNWNIMSLTLFAIAPPTVEAFRRIHLHFPALPFLFSFRLFSLLFLLST